MRTNTTAEHDLTNPVAALRLLRKAAYRDVDGPDLAEAVSTVAGPLTDLSDAWVNVHTIVSRLDAANSRIRPTRGDLAVALVRLDAALAVFLGSSGWEPPPEHATAPGAL
jgi:hypothetical protein